MNRATTSARNGMAFRRVIVDSRAKVAGGRVCDDEETYTTALSEVSVCVYGVGLTVLTVEAPRGAKSRAVPGGGLRDDQARRVKGRGKGGNDSSGTG